MNDSPLLLASILTGVCVAVTTFANRANYAQLLDFVEADLAFRLRSLRAPTKHLRKWLNFWVGLTGTVFVVFFVLDLIPPAVLVVVLMSAGPWYLIRRWSDYRRQKIEDQLADAMVTFSSAIRAGLSIAQALELLTQECPRPISEEFRQIVGEYQMGKPLERTLTEAKDRLRSENFILFAAALLASRESGGRLNETVERISTSVLEVQRLERKVRSETAQARKSAVYMALVPLFILIVYSYFEPDNVGRFFGDPIGQMMFTAAVALNILAYIWAVKILNPDI